MRWLATSPKKHNQMRSYTATNKSWRDQDLNFASCMWDSALLKLRCGPDGRVSLRLGRPPGSTLQTGATARLDKAQPPLSQTGWSWLPQPFDEPCNLLDCWRPWELPSFHEPGLCATAGRRQPRAVLMSQSWPGYYSEGDTLLLPTFSGCSSTHAHSLVL